MNVVFTPFLLPHLKIWQKLFLSGIAVVVDFLSRFLKRFEVFDLKFPSRVILGIQARIVRRALHVAATGLVR